MTPQPLNFFLKTRQHVEDCGQQLRNAGLMEHGLSCKNFDLSCILPHLGHGNLLDMGSNGSYMLYNAVKMNLQGEKHGIDISYPDGYVLRWPVENGEVVPGVQCQKADLMDPPFENEKFDYITCLSVIEHEVDFNKLAAQCSRLLKPGGKLFITFDYWNPKLDTTGKELFGLKWNVLCQNEVFDLVRICRENNLRLCFNPNIDKSLGEESIDWTTQDAVINETFCAPFPAVAYTFGIFMFEKM